MDFLWAFLVGGAICSVGQVLIDWTKLTTARILVIYITLGVILGGIGGRIDHTIANIRTLSDIAENGGRGFLIGNDAVLTVIKDNIAFPETSSGYISVFSNEKGTAVTEKGLKYTLENTPLTPSTTLGTSNEFVGERAQISVKDGSLLVIWYENQEIFLKNLNYYIKKEL